MIKTFFQRHIYTIGGGIIAVLLGGIMFSAGVISQRKEDTIVSRTAKVNKTVLSPEKDEIQKNIPPQRSEFSRSNSVLPITQIAVQKGLLTCAEKVNRVFARLGRTGQIGTCLLPATSRADARLFASSSELVLANSSMFVSATFSPDAENASAAVVESVEYAAKACDAVAKEYFSGRIPVVLKKSLRFYGNESVSYVLMPAGEGCNIIKKETVR
jgi:hypothetical protein